MITTDSLARQLVALDVGSHTGRMRADLGDLRVLAVFNLLLAGRLKVPPLAGTAGDRDLLLESAILDSVEVPRVLLEVDTAMGGGYFRRTHAVVRPHLSLEQYLTEFAFEYWKQYRLAPSRLPPYLLDLFTRPISWAFRAGADQVPMMLSVSLANAAVDPGHPLAWKRVPPEAEHVAALAWFTRWQRPLLGGGAEGAMWWDDLLTSPSANVEDADQFGISKLVEGLYWSTPDVLDRYDLGTREGKLGIVAWYQRWLAPTLLGARHDDWFVVAVNGLADALKPLGVEFPLAGPPHPAAPPPVDTPADVPRPILRVAHEGVARDGVNLVGWPLADIGIGVDVRSAAAAFEAAAFPYCVIDASDRVSPGLARVDQDLPKGLTDRRRFACDLVFLDTATQFRYYAAALLAGEPVAQPVIGVCPWELPLWPQEAAFALQSLDYFWAASRFERDAFAPYLDEARIMLAPPAVTIEGSRTDELVPAEPTGPLRFLTIFDGLSSIHRKNPFATIRAFRAAFHERSDVRLTVKYMNLRAGNPLIDEMTALIGDDPRVDLLGETLTRSQLVELVRSSHCFVSLHRAEGFGRNIAESMLLGRPVICSTFSGNLDFCSEGNAFLVEGTIVPVRPVDYAMSEGQSWFDPSVDHAVVQMRRVYENWNDARQIAAAGRDFVRTHHSAEAAGRRYVELLHSIL
jgi:glycosyltransferase involved in cell wall biosynthesis